MAGAPGFCLLLSLCVCCFSSFRPPDSSGTDSARAENRRRIFHKTGSFHTDDFCRSFVDGIYHSGYRQGHGVLFLIHIQGAGFSHFRFPFIVIRSTVGYTATKPVHKLIMGGRSAEVPLPKSCFQQGFPRLVQITPVKKNIAFADGHLFLGG